MKSVFWHGSWLDVLSVYTKVDDTWKLVRDIKPNIDGVWKNTGYIPKNRLYQSDWGSWNWDSNLITFYYGSYYVYGYSQIYEKILNNIIYINCNFQMSSGGSAVLNRPWGLYTSDVASGGQNTFVDTGLRITPTAMNTVYVVEGYISQRNIKRLIFMPISSLGSGVSYSLGYYPNKIYQKL